VGTTEPQRKDAAKDLEEMARKKNLDNGPKVQLEENGGGSTRQR